MATRKIETTIALDGEQKFKQALASASREMRVMESEARALSAAYDQNGNAAAFFASRQQNLRNQIQQQEQIVSALEKAVRDSAETYGEASAQTDGWAIKLNNARTRLSKLQKELEATDREAEELGRDSVKVGRQIENGIGDGAREAEDSVNSLFEAMQRDISSIKTSGAITAVKSLWDMAAGAYGGVEGFVSSTAEYRRQLSFLQQNAETQGYDFSKIKSQLIEVQALTGESSSAVEGLSNLLQTGMTTDQMERAIENLAGAVISFPDTLKFESLADGLQETLATGEATGQFAELLERMGVDIDEFNKALDESPTAVGDLEIALAYMAAGGLNDVYTKWQATNKEMTDAQKTQAAIEMELAEFAGTLEEYVVGPTKSAVLKALQYANQTVELAEKEGLGAAAKKVAEDAAEAKKTGEQVIKDTLSKPGQLIYDTMPEALQNTVDVIEETVGAILEPITDPAGFIKKKYEASKKDEEIDDTKAERQIETLTSILAGRHYGETPASLTGPNGEEYFVIGAGKTAEQVVRGLNENKNAYQNAGAQAADAFMNGMETQLDTSLWGEGKEAEKLVTISPVEMEEEGKGAGEAMTDGFEEGVGGMEGEAQKTGAAIGAAFGSGLASQVSYVSAQSSALAAAAAAGLRAAAAMGALRGISTPGVINLDGRQVGNVLFPTMSEMMAVNG